MLYMNYPFLLTDSQWDEVSQYFEAKERKRKHTLKVIASAVLYLLKTGCQWRLLPESEQNWGSLRARCSANYHSTTAWTARRSRAANLV